jgi:hypothetical protein
MKDIEIIDNSIIFRQSEKLVSHASDSFEIPLFGAQADFAYDEVREVFWLHVVKTTVSEFYMLGEDGTIIKTFPVVYDNVIPSTGGGFFVTDNMALISARGGAERTRLIVDLDNGTYEKYYIDNLKYEEIMGFSGESIFGDKWSYNFKTSILTNFPDNIYFYRYIPKADKLIGLTGEGFIVIYDYALNKFDKTGIARKIYKNKFTYKPDDLYYLDDNYLYYSDYGENIPPVLYFTFFLDAPEPRNWYRANIKTGKAEIVKSPSKFSTIIGTINDSVE